MENKGKIKYKHKTFRRVAHAFAVTCGITFFTMLSTIIPALIADGIHTDIKDIGREVKESESFKNYFKQKHAEYYNDFNNDKLTLDEYTDKLNQLDTVEYVLDNLEEIAPERVEEVNKMQEKADDLADKTMTVSGIAGAAAFASSIPAAHMILLSKKYKEKDYEEMSM